MNVTVVILLLGFLLAGAVAVAQDSYRKYSGIPIGIAVLWAVFLFWQGSQYRSCFDSVGQGNSEAEVVAIMGSPHRSTDGTVSIYGGPKPSTEETPGCVRELWYRAALTPEQWAICFDDEGRVIDKFHYASY